MTNPDPLELPNRYRYVRSNPTNNADPSGLICVGPLCTEDLESGIANAGSFVANIPGDAAGLVGLEEVVDKAIAYPLIAEHAVITGATDLIYDNPEATGAFVALGTVVLLSSMDPALGIGAGANLIVGLAKGKYSHLPANELIPTILNDAFEGATGYSYTGLAYEVARTQLPSLDLPPISFGIPLGDGVSIPVPPNLFESPEPVGSCPIDDSDEPDCEPNCVVRGGISEPEHLIRAYKELPMNAGLGEGIFGLSVNYEPGISIEELARTAALPNNQISFASREKLLAAAVSVGHIITISPSARSFSPQHKYHATLSAFDSQHHLPELPSGLSIALSTAFTKSKNPAKE